MQTYYFHIMDGATIRDKRGLEFPTVGGAIEHCKDLMRRLRDDPRLTNDPALSISVIDESGAEIHRERVYKRLANPKRSANP